MTQASMGTSLRKTNLLCNKISDARFYTGMYANDFNISIFTLNFTGFDFHIINLLILIK